MEFVIMKGMNTMKAVLGISHTYVYIIYFPNCLHTIHNPS